MDEITLIYIGGAFCIGALLGVGAVALHAEHAEKSLRGQIARDGRIIKQLQKKIEEQKLRLQERDEALRRAWGKVDSLQKRDRKPGLGKGRHRR